MACKGHVLALSEMRLDTPGGKAHFLEVVSRRHKRVNRSTFAAETNGSADALEPAKVVAMQFTEVVRGVCTAGQLASLAEVELGCCRWRPSWTRCRSSRTSRQLT